MRNNRRRQFASRVGGEVPQTQKTPPWANGRTTESKAKNNRMTSLEIKAAEKKLIEEQNALPWAGNFKRYSTPHFRHPDLRAKQSKEQALAISESKKIVKCEQPKMPVGFGLHTGDRILVWADPDSGRISSEQWHPTNYVQREVVAVASFCEQPDSEPGSEWLGEEWSPIVYLPFPSEGARKLDDSEFAKRNPHGTIVNVDTEVLGLLKADSEKEQFRVLWYPESFKFVAATKPPLTKTRQKTVRSSDLEEISGEDLRRLPKRNKAPAEKYPMGMPEFVNESDFRTAKETSLLDEEDTDDDDTTENDQSSEADEEYQVQKTEPEPLKLRDGTRLAYIYQMLLRHKRPLHMDEIISKLQKKNLLSKTGLHIYSSVYSPMSKRYEIFEKVEEATFTIRNAFKKQAKVKDIPVVGPVKSTTKTLQKSIKSLVEIVADAAKIVSTPYGTYPSLVHRYMSEMGHTVPYQSVHRAMQNKDYFKRNKFWYQPL